MKFLQSKFEFSCCAKHTWILTLAELLWKNINSKKITFFQDNLIVFTKNNPWNHKSLRPRLLPTVPQHIDHYIVEEEVTSNQGPSKRDQQRRRPYCRRRNHDRRRSRSGCHCCGSNVNKNLTGECGRKKDLGWKEAEEHPAKNWPRNSSDATVDNSFEVPNIFGKPSGSKTLTWLNLKTAIDWPLNCILYMIKRRKSVDRLDKKWSLPLWAKSPF